MLHWPKEIHYGSPPPEGADVLWRLECRRYSTIIDAEREEYGVTDPQLTMSWYSVKHRTPKGARLNFGIFVNLTKHKKWACKTPEEAIESFRRRKEKQIQILTGKLRSAKNELTLLEAWETAQNKS